MISQAAWGFWTGMPAQCSSFQRHGLCVIGQARCLTTHHDCCTVVSVDPEQDHKPHEQIPTSITLCLG